MENKENMLTLYLKGGLSAKDAFDFFAGSGAPSVRFEADGIGVLEYGDFLYGLMELYAEELKGKKRFSVQNFDDWIAVLCAEKKAQGLRPMPECPACEVFAVCGGGGGQYCAAHKYFFKKAFPLFGEIVITKKTGRPPQK